MRDVDASRRDYSKAVRAGNARIKPQLYVFHSINMALLRGGLIKERVA
jgi:hypothetical protein